MQVAKVLIVGAPSSWSHKKEAQVESNGKTWTAHIEVIAATSGRAAYAVMRGLGVRVGDDWTVRVV